MKSTALLMAAGGATVLASAIGGVVLGPHDPSESDFASRAGTAAAVVGVGAPVGGVLMMSGALTNPNPADAPAMREMATTTTSGSSRASACR